MKNARSGIYEEETGPVEAPGRGLLQATNNEDDIEMSESEPRLKKPATTSLRQEIKQVKKNGELSEEDVMKNILNGTIKIDLKTFLAYAPEIEKEWFGRRKVKPAEDPAPLTVGLKPVGAFEDEEEDTLAPVSTSSPPRLACLGHDIVSRDC
jgi:hypothetical protein